MTAFLAPGADHPMHSTMQMPLSFRPAERSLVHAHGYPVGMALEAESPFSPHAPLPSPQPSPMPHSFSVMRADDQEDAMMSISEHKSASPSPVAPVAPHPRHLQPSPLHMSWPDSPLCPPTPTDDANSDSPMRSPCLSPESAAESPVFTGRSMSSGPAKGATQSAQQQLPRPRAQSTLRLETYSTAARPFQFSARASSQPHQLQQLLIAQEDNDTPTSCISAQSAGVDSGFESQATAQVQRRNSVQVSGATTTFAGQPLRCRRTLDVGSGRVQRTQPQPQPQPQQPQQAPQQVPFRPIAPAGQLFVDVDSPSAHNSLIPTTSPATALSNGMEHLQLGSGTDFGAERPSQRIFSFNLQATAAPSQAEHKEDEAQMVVTSPLPPRHMSASPSMRGSPYGATRRVRDEKHPPYPRPHPHSTRLPPRSLSVQSFTSSGRCSSGSNSPVGASASMVHGSPLASVDEATVQYVPKLPCEEGSKYDMGANVISAQTAARVVGGDLRDAYDRIIVIDCRYEYEYSGGHIDGAVWCPNFEAVDQLLFQNPVGGVRTAVLVHCEFSQRRGPKSCRNIRKRDRELHGVEGFPNLYYPELYLIAGGYKEFFTHFSDLCSPREYVGMFDPRFTEQLTQARRNV